MLLKSGKVITKLLIQTRKMHLLHDKTYINGQWISAASNKIFEVLNPADGSIISTVPDMDIEDTQKAIESAANAFETWKNTTPKERSYFLRNWYNLLIKNRDNLAKIITLESGKPLPEALGEVNYGNSFVEWFSEQARNVRGEIIQSSTTTKKILVEHYPIGVAALITPWNFPHAMITRKVSPALAVGCTCVIKPAEDTPLTALALLELAEEAGIPKGVLNIVTSGRKNAPKIGKLLCESSLVAGISFTGSTQVGKILYKQCSAGVKRLGLELGGNAPFIVYNTADVDKAVEGAVTAKFRNCGQACVAANRFLVQEGVYDSFVGKLVDRVKDLKIGCGFDSGVRIGPLINRAQFEKISNLVGDAVAKGAKVVIGGIPAPKIGELFYEPTVVVDVNKNTMLFSEEIFGPVIGIVKFKTEEESLDIANGTDRGLAAYFYSEDIKQIFRVNRNLEAGMIGVNEGLISTVEAPFGGIKESGIGREGSHRGVEEYTYIKYTCIGNLE
ncbi:glutarate-semialdehyde dehydrogenase [Diorhabda carinulata]|uniref:glutarate-semialdehyde dehydrogenase n=1 Tax=Diorhabda carinulata TaxID=1163345 RepID=UPI0025A171A9|nr:glutarate-semialdehyde dehydrogenase [Diorhabda carinulata]